MLSVAAMGWSFLICLLDNYNLVLVPWNVSGSLEGSEWPKNPKFWENTRFWKGLLHINKVAKLWPRGPRNGPRHVIHRWKASVALASVIEAIATPLSDILNCCFDQGVFPNCLKAARVIPVFKKEQKELLTNYRPISLLPAANKIAEKAIHKRLVDFASRNNIFSDRQFGFRASHSTVHAMTALLHQAATDADDSKYQLAFFFDLRRHLTRCHITKSCKNWSTLV